MRRRRASAGSTERIRLTAVYGGLLVLMSFGTAILIYAILQQSLESNISNAVQLEPVSTQPGFATTLSPSSPEFPLVTGKPPAVAATASHAALQELWTTSWIVLTLFAALSVLLAWWLAGRVLRPVAAITGAARRLSAGNLRERIALGGPPGELRRLADTFDTMAERIEQLVAAQQRFAAHAAHELRTNLAVQRAAAEIGLADPDPQRVELIRHKLLEAANDCEALIESLLLLATADQGIKDIKPVRLDVVAEHVAAELAPLIRDARVTLEPDLEPLTACGDRVLLEHLLHNLLINAIKYNIPNGTVRLRVGPDGLTVSNTGIPVPAERVEELFEPFRRLHPRRRAPGEGAGLGLSVVASIVRAHGAAITAAANPHGGLRIHVVFPKERGVPHPNT